MASKNNFIFISYATTHVSPREIFSPAIRTPVDVRDYKPDNSIIETRLFIFFNLNSNLILNLDYN